MNVKNLTHFKLEGVAHIRRDKPENGNKDTPGSKVTTLERTAYTSVISESMDYSPPPLPIHKLANLRLQL